MKLKAYGDKTIGKILPNDDTTKSGLILLGETVDEENKGCFFIEVVSTNHPELSVGDLVITHKFYGTPLTIEGEKYLILDEKGMLASIPKEDKQ